MLHTTKYCCRWHSPPSFCSHLAPVIPVWVCACLPRATGIRVRDERVLAHVGPVLVPHCNGSAAPSVRTNLAFTHRHPPPSATIHHRRQPERDNADGPKHAHRAEGLWPGSRCDGWGGRIEARHWWNCSWILSHVLSTTASTLQSSPFTNSTTTSGCRRLLFSDQLHLYRQHANFLAGMRSMQTRSWRGLGGADTRMVGSVHRPTWTHTCCE